MIFRNRAVPAISFCDVHSTTLYAHARGNSAGSWTMEVMRSTRNRSRFPRTARASSSLARVACREARASSRPRDPAGHSPRNPTPAHAPVARPRLHLCADVGLDAKVEFACVGRYCLRCLDRSGMGRLSPSTRRGVVTRRIWRKRVARHNFRTPWLFQQK